MTTPDEAPPPAAETVTPEPDVAAVGLKAKILAQPDWLWGLALGGAISALLLVVVLPRQEYGRPVKTPEDRQLAEAATPLSAELAGRLADARAQLERGKIDAALQGFNAVLAERPANQEARWLLASTFDRLGDQVRAAQHYKVFLDVHDRARVVQDDRATRARERLRVWEGMP